MSKKDITYRTNPELPTIKKDWKGNLLINGEFCNDSIEESRSMWKAIKWKLSKNPQAEQKKRDKFKLASMHLDLNTSSDNNIIWLGHSSFVLNINGVRLLTDPCFFDLPVTRRNVALPCDINELTDINYLLVSHDHRDHFDKKSVDIIAKNNPLIKALLPLNAERIFNSKELKRIEVQEAGWYQEYNIQEDIRIVFLPAKHWCKRGVFDYNKTLWGSFLIITDKLKIFFSGDTAYDNKIFKDINSIFGNIDICLLPIGAYSPKSMMKDSHTTPEEAVQIFNDLKGTTFIPMHYGTYDLSDEPLGEPIERLTTCFNEHKEKVKILKVGEIYDLNAE
jgi:L-ascorbate metabolism protein UlaG (beta-lactamase superfamily)